MASLVLAVPSLRLVRASPADGEVAADVDPLRALAEAARDGDLAAFEALYERTRGQVHAILYRLVGPGADLEDLVQDAYLQLLKALKGFRGQARLTTYLYRVCANVGLMHLRRGRRHPEELVAEVPDSTAGAESDPERAVHVKQASALMERALTALPAERRVVFVYYELMGLKPEEIGEAISIPTNTVRSRLSRAREEFTEAVASLSKGKAGGS